MNDSIYAYQGLGQALLTKKWLNRLLPSAEVQAKAFGGNGFAHRRRWNVQVRGLRAAQDFESSSVLSFLSANAPVSCLKQ
jgi:hypothetical protein